MFFQGGELIFSCKDDAKQQPELNDLIQHLRPYFPHSNGLYNSHQPGKAVLNEFIQVICSALLSGGDSNRSGEPRKGHLSESRPHCEASPFPRDLLRNGEDFGWPSVGKHGFMSFKILLNKCNVNLFTDES